ncbi:hypothetical protein GOV11_02500 [Candidatus Woesearchaeota archaeon]|nr:hypothetical protein [Candidatus Woesearchaeota archaeon]
MPDDFDKKIKEADEKEKAAEEYEKKLQREIEEELHRNSNAQESMARSQASEAKGESRLADAAERQAIAEERRAKAMEDSLKRGVTPGATPGTATLTRKGGGGKGKKSSKDTMSLAELFFFIALMAHMLVYIFSGAPKLLMLPVYIAMSGSIAIAWFFVSGERRVQSLVGISLFAAMVYILPEITSTYQSYDAVNIVSGFVALYIPIWPVYFWQRIAQEKEGAAKAFRIYIFVVVAIPLIIVFMSAATGTGVDLMPDWLDPAENTVNPVTGMWTLLWEKFNSLGDNIYDVYNQTLNPGAYYTGRVEKNSKGEMGVVIENFRTIDPEFTNTSTVVLYGSVYAKSFLEESDSVRVMPTCVVEGRDIQEAVPDPIILDIPYGTSGTFECTFLKPFQKGNYRAKAQATFPFQTWSYITYTFVDDERVRNMARQGLDVRKELDIDAEPEAIYTSGPVSLGMGGTPQPIRIIQEDPYLPEGTRIGIMLDPQRGGGSLNKVDKYELKVPRPFYVYDCDRCKDNYEVCGQEQDENDPDYTNYIFTNLETGPITGFTSITCKLGIDDSQQAMNLANLGDKVMRSFIAVAHYKYTIEESSVVRVR